MTASRATGARLLLASDWRTAVDDADSFVSPFVDRDDCFVLVIWNVEIIICRVFCGQFTLSVADVPESARGGVVILGQHENETLSLTDNLRAGVDRFTIMV